MKKIFTSLTLIMFALCTQAQYLPNYGFDSWKTACGSTEAFGTGIMSSPKTGEMRKRPGVEPSEWNGSSINQKVITTAEMKLVFNEDNSVKMQNIFVGAGSLGSVAPGFITLGTPWVYAETSVSNCDGGTYGGVSFTNKPDAITGRFKRTDSNDENSYIIAYLWNGTYTSKVGKKGSPTQNRDNVERAIFEKVETSAKGTLIAKCNYGFNTTNGDWQTITVPIEYVNDATPTMMNVVISGGNYWDRGSLIENTTLYADDIQFVYYSELTSLMYNNNDLIGKFTTDANDSRYHYLTLDEAYDESKLGTYTMKSRFSTEDCYFDSETNELIITVMGNDYDETARPDNFNVYTIKFAGHKVSPTIGYASLYLGYNAVIPEGVKAYIVTSTNSTHAIFQEITGVIPANTGVIIEAANGDYNFEQAPATAALADVTGNLLEGTTRGGLVWEEAYILSIKNGTVGLYMVNMGEEAGSAWDCKANKAYLPVSAVANKTIAFYGFDFDGTTGIEDAIEAPVVEGIYDLMGRKLNEITKPGIYIVNGKKVLVK